MVSGNEEMRAEVKVGHDYVSLEESPRKESVQTHTHSQITERGNVIIAVAVTFQIGWEVR